MAKPRVSYTAPVDMHPLDVAQAIVGEHVRLKAEPLRGAARTFRHYLAMEQNCEVLTTAYRRHLDKLITLIREHAERHAIDTLHKAGDAHPATKPLIPPEHMEHIRTLIGDMHLAFIATMVGPGVVSAETVQRLIDKGVVPRDLAYSFVAQHGETASEAARVIADAYNYGVLLGRDPLLRARAKTLTLPAAQGLATLGVGIVAAGLGAAGVAAAAVRRTLQRQRVVSADTTADPFTVHEHKHPIPVHAGNAMPGATHVHPDAWLATAEAEPDTGPFSVRVTHEVAASFPLTAQQEAARAWAEHHAANEIVGLGNRIADDFGTIAIEADAALQAAYEQDIRDSVVDSIARRDAWRTLAGKLGDKTKDWSRDFGRIAATETQSASQAGISAGLVSREGDPKQIMVYKLPSPRACDDCVRLHLTAGPGSKPRVFPLSELTQNGTNVGVRRASWKPVIGPVHPWCSCELIHIPHGWGLNDDGDIVPLGMLRAGLLPGDLRKAGGALLTFAGTSPDTGCAVHIGDPRKKAIIDRVIAGTPKAIFDKRVGVTLICEDQPRVGNALDDHDLGYWTGNEIRLAITIPLDRVEGVVKHELGHSLNVWLMYQLGGVAPVRAWQSKLYAKSKREGFCTKYASTNPIENAAELTRLYLYDRMQLMTKYPSAFAMLHDAYREIFRPRNDRPIRPGEPFKQARDKADAVARDHAKL